MALSFESSLLSTFLKGSSFAALPLRAKEVDIPVFRTELPVGIIGIYGIGSHTSYPYIHQLLLHTEKDVSGNPVYIGVKHRTRYGSHPFD